MKNEESNLERCLDSLLPIMEQVSSELIIVDTGSNDRTVEIARRYTEKVYFHEWNNHFSDMRNMSISYAQGEWIFIFDADEELDDPEGLVKVLKFEKLNKANTIRLQVKNILSYKTPRDIYHISERLFRNDGSFRYEGSVHNQPRYKHPLLNTDVLINHYGYNNDDAELMEKKFKRTSALLLQELEKDPENIYYLWQLARSYLMHKDTADSLRYVEQAYNLVKKNEGPASRATYYYVYGEYCRILSYNENYEKCIEICKEILELSPQYIDMHYYLALSSQELGKQEDAIESYKNYLQLYDDYLENRLDLKQFTGIEIHAVDSRIATATSSQVVEYYFNKEEFEEALKYIRYMDERRETCLAVMRTLIKLERYEPIAHYYRNLKNKELIPVFIECLEYELSLLEQSQVEEISKAFSKGDDKYAEFNAIRVSATDKALIKKFIDGNDFNNLPLNPYSQVIDYAINAEFPVRALLQKMTDGKIKQCIKLVIDRSKDLRGFFEEFVQNTNARENDHHTNRVIASIGNVLFLTAVEETKQNKTELSNRYLALSESYLQAGMNFVASLYQMQGIRMMYKTMDHVEHKFYILLFLAKDALSKGYQKNAFDYYKEAAEIYPYLADLVKLVITNLQSDSSKQSILLSIEQQTTKAGDNLKVLQGTIEIANQMSLLTRGLNQTGVFAKSLTYQPNYLKYYADYEFDIQANPNSERMMKDLNEISLKAIEHFDVFHFHFGTSLRVDHSDLPLLKEAKKAVLMHYWGSDVRMLSIARKWNPFVQVKFADEDQIKRKLEHMGSMIDHCVVADHELYQYVKGYHKNIHFIKQTIDTDLYRPLEGFKFRKKKPVVVHAPTSPEIKGTKYILQAVEQLKETYDFEFMLIQNKSHEEARQLYQQADIVLDELLCGSYGILALESMAMGKPLITYINEHVRETYPKELPIVSANPDTVKEALIPLLKDWELREELGKKGRRYVQEHHEVTIIAKQFIDLYKTIKP
ncbi:glycosyltransferase [Paenibacillus sp. WST5]|uniref:Glycosyltransferase n=1 Tax=Paenibacillus sedimenti TaxID=2770274 RepID=A0A926QLR0_9BACL|nr:glycosyltransferase [Paenibacillus sedimenti]